MLMPTASSRPERRPSRTGGRSCYARHAEFRFVPRRRRCARGPAPRCRVPGRSHRTRPRRSRPCRWSPVWCNSRSGGRTRRPRRQGPVSSCLITAALPASRSTFHSSALAHSLQPDRDVRRGQSGAARSAARARKGIATWLAGPGSAAPNGAPGAGRGKDGCCQPGCRGGIPAATARAWTAARSADSPRIARHFGAPGIGWQPRAGLRRT